MKKLLLLLGLIICFNGRSQSWVPVDLNTTLNFYDVNFLNNENGWIAGEAGVVFRFHDNSWNEMDAGTSNSLRGVFMVDTNDVWLVGNGGTIIHYTTGGFQPYISPTTKTLNDIYMFSSQLGWIAGEDGTLLVFDGVSWQNESIIPSPIFPNHLETDDLKQIDFLNEDFGVIAGEWGIYLEYRNGTWTDESWSNIQSFESVEIIDTNTVAIGGWESNPAIMSCFIFTFNPNRDFLYFNEGWPYPMPCVKIIENDGWALVGNGEILKFNGSEFETFEHLSYDLESIAYMNDTTGWIAGHWGTLLRLTHTVNADLGEDRSFCEGHAVVLDPGNEFISYLWSTGDTTPVIEVYQPGEYWVTVTDEYGAAGTDTVVLTMIPVPDTPTIISGPTELDSLDNIVSTYTASVLTGITEYIWHLEPAEAGIIYGNNEIATVLWQAGYTGTAEIKVKGKNLECDGEFSAPYVVNVNSPLVIDETESVMDWDGNIYQTVTIGTQVWMAQNLRTTHFKNGFALQNIEDPIEWVYASDPAYCNYNNQEENSYTYGRIYHKNVMDYTFDICPDFWHTPTEHEWWVLKDYLGSENAGGKLKEAGTSRWLYPNNEASDQTGFHALPGGRMEIEYGIYDYAYFTGMNEVTSFWAANKTVELNLNYLTGAIENTDYSPGGCYIRCISDYAAVIKENNEKANLQVIPNPTSGMFRIETDHVTDIQIYNASGLLVYTGNSALNDISNFPDGIYFILARTGNGVLTGKILKQQ